MTFVKTHGAKDRPNGSILNWKVSPSKWKHRKWWWWGTIGIWKCASFKLTFTIQSWGSIARRTSDVQSVWKGRYFSVLFRYLKSNISQKSLSFLEWWSEQEKKNCVAAGVLFPLKDLFPVVSEFQCKRFCVSLGLSWICCLWGDDYERPLSHVSNDMVPVESHMAGIAEPYMIDLVAGLALKFASASSPAEQIGRINSHFKWSVLLLKLTPCFWSHKSSVQCLLSCWTKYLTRNQRKVMQSGSVGFR